MIKNAIITAARPKSKYPPMSLDERAAQFGAFAALGEIDSEFDDLIDEWMEYGDNLAENSDENGSVCFYFSL